jgi:hypothetical protein
MNHYRMKHAGETTNPQKELGIQLDRLTKTISRKQRERQ